MADLAKLTKEVLIEMVTSLETLKASLEAENATLKETVESQKEVIEAKEQELTEAVGLLEEQQNALAAAVAPIITSDKSRITHEGETYLVEVPKFQLSGVEYTAADLEDNAELVAKLIARESGILKLVTE